MPMKVVAFVAVALIGLAPQPARFKARIDAVQVDALVTDGRHPIANLRPEDFELRDNGVLQRVERAGAETVPLEIIIALDNSTSVAGKPLAELKRAATATIDTLRPGLDHAAILPFSHEVSFVSALSDDRRRLAEAIDGLEARGGTSLRDAVATGLMLRRTPGTRRLLLVYTDGLDTFSWLSPDEALAVASRTDAVIYVIGTGNATVHLNAQLSENTGGAYLRAANPNKLQDVFAQIVSEFRNRYLLTYFPEGVKRSGWHTIELALKNRKAQIRARRGYQGD